VDNEAKNNNDDLKRNVHVTAHKETLEELTSPSRLNVNPHTGLDDTEAKQRLVTHGMNMLTPPKQTPVWIKFLKELSGFFSLLLWGGALLCFIGYSIDGSEDHLFLGIVLVLVVVVTGIFSFVQNSKSESLMNSFKSMLPPKVKVLRDGTTDEVISTRIVPGDIVYVEGGDLIPADIRVLECSDNFQVDNAALTGESEPQKRSSVCTHDDPLETQNLCFFGTQVPEGSCKALVIETGDRTVMGRVAALAMSTKKEQTPINKEIHHFILIISGIALFLGVLFFLLNIGIGTPYIENLVFMIGIIVANVPEGLLATVTVCLTLTAKRMHAKKVLVKNLEGVETLGSTSCICSDKTGTLTMNVMTVAQVVYGGANAFVTEDAPSSFTGGKKTYDTTNVCFQKLLRCAALCNVATFTECSKWKYKDDGETKERDEFDNAIPIPFKGVVTQGDGSTVETYHWKPVGNASECAMIKLVQSESSMPRDEYDVDSIRSSYPVKKTIPFNSKNKYQVHVHEDSSSGRHIVLMKGAPERILDRCTHAVIGGKVIELTEDERINIVNQQEALSANGLRCLGFAEKELDPNVYNNNYKYAADSDEFFSPNFPIGDKPSEVIDSHDRRQNPISTGGLVFLGMTALIDPPRPAVPGAVKRCQTAGIKVIMVTGDHPITAQAIAFKCGILWSKTRGDMIKDNAKFGRMCGSADYEDPNDADAIVVTGSELSPDMKESDWDFILNHRQVVFARTSPQQKLIIVENCQRLGHIVAVTGDGVNDSPAIKKADIGIAMGISGSEVSKQAADMILLDDNFASIVNGVEEGRLIFDNLKKSIAYTIQSNIPEITPFLAFIIFAIPLPLTTFLILAIDLGTDMIPAISMASEQPEADIMQRKPRTKSDRLVTPAMISFSYGYIGMIQALAGFFTYMVVLNDYGYHPYILFNRGNSDAWGHQPLFCKFSGGHYVNLAGDINMALNPSLDPPTREYPFWFEGYDGEVVDCGYAYNNFRSDGSPTQFDFRDSDTYTGQTKGKHSATTESYEAMEQNHYFEYVPWRGRLSSYWDDSMLFHNTNDANKGGNLGQNTNYFRGRAAGLWSLCEQTSVSSCENQFCGERGSAVIRGVQVPEVALNADPSRFTTNCSAQPSMTNNVYDNALFCNGQGSETLSKSCASVNQYDLDEKIAYPNNHFQTFYCMGLEDSCGQLTDEAATLPFCDLNGNVCGTFGNKSEDCSFMCEGYCYWPGSNAVKPNTNKVSSFAQFQAETPGTSTAEYQQCINIASQETAHEALKHAQGAFFVSIVIGQIAGLLVCKTRWLSIKNQGMKNRFMLFGIGTEILLVLFLCYCKPLNVGLGTRNLRLVHFFPAIPFAILIFCFDEARKALMRITSAEKVDHSGHTIREKGWIERNFGY
jgi:sodium/potassium-transporting ATPase subunit alpha